MNESANAKKAVPPLEILRDLYEVERLSLAEAGKRLGVSSQTFYRWLQDTDGIRPRTVSEARKVAKKHVYSEETLERMRTRAAAMREKVTVETRRKQAASMMGKTPWNRGVPMSDATREKLVAVWTDPEYRRKASERLMGDKSPSWKGGIKPELARRLDRAEWRRTRREVYERDQWLCQDCGTRCLNSSDAKAHPKRKIQAHHLVSRRDGGSDELSNLVTLCMSCHHKRERLSPAGPAAPWGSAGPAPRPRRR